MTAPVHVVWDDVFTRYDFGAGHPMSPIRLDLTARLCGELGLFEGPQVQLSAPQVPDDALLETVHAPAYIAAVRAASLDPAGADAAFGLGTDDDPAFAGMHEASARIVEGTRVVAQAVWNGEAEHGVNFTGGMHHAMPERAAGFCIYNDAAVAIRALLDQGAQRIVYIDVDAHHGDGVERVFWDDPRVLTVSLHETGTVLFPGTGFPGDLGGSDASGQAVNIALPPGTRDMGWLRAFHAVVPQLVHAFRPELIVSQHGADSHFTDPLAHLAVSVDAQRQAMETIHDLAHEVCGGKWVALGGGGYEIVGVVPRSWTHLVGIATHHPVSVDAAVPQPWLDDVKERFGIDAPATMGDGVSEGGRVWWKHWDSGFNPEDALDRAVMATREAVFPLHGLDVWFD